MSDATGAEPDGGAEATRSQIAAETLRFNERTKLSAAWLNGVATAVVAAGTFTPLFAAIYGISVPHIRPGYVALVSGFCIVASGALHLVGRFLLNRLRP